MSSSKWGVFAKLRRAVAAAAVVIVAQPAVAALLGVDIDTGQLYSISGTTASRTLIGSTGVSGFGALEFAPNGTLYGVTTSNAALYTINPTTAAATLVGSLGLGFVFEGGLAFAPNGLAYGMNSGNAGAAGLFTINLATGAATDLGSIGPADINGLAFRGDGMLVGLDRVTDSLLLIDPTTLAVSLLAAVPTVVGAVGGMTIDGGIGFYNTSGPGSTAPGSDTLYSFDLSTGASTFIGILGTDTRGISGLAAGPTTAVPEPGTLMLIACALGVWCLARRRMPV